MEEQKKFPEPVEALLVILFSFGIVISFALIISLITSFSIINISIEESNRYFYIIGGLLFLVAPTMYIRYKKYNINQLFRLNPISGEIVQLSILIGLSISVVSDELDRLIQIIIPAPEFLQEILKLMIAQNVWDWILLIIGTVLIASIAEEFLFRGFLQVTLEKKGDVTRAVILTSLSWTLVHTNPYWAVQIFAMGIIIGFLAWRANSVFPGIIVHITNNLLSLIFINSEMDNVIDWYLVGDHVNPIILLPSILILVWSIRKISFIYANNQS